MTTSERTKIALTLQKALTLAIFTLLCTSLLTLVFFLTKLPIERSTKLELEQRLHVLLPQASYNNMLDEDHIDWQDAMLGSTKAHRIWRARLDNKPIAAIITVLAHGYGGPITLLVAISWDQQLIAARVLSHSETPGLGDDIEISRSQWINGFTGSSLDSLTAKQWRVKKDGGAFDHFTGATVTPRAVVSAIHSTLSFFSKNREKIFEL